MHDLTPEGYQRIIATLAEQKKVAELAALEWQVRYENATRPDTGESTDGAIGE